jgi:hypothetical protein
MNTQNLEEDSLKRLTLSEVKASGSFEGSTDYILTSFGLTATGELKCPYLGACPIHGVDIVVDLSEPIDWGPGQRFKGEYKLVRLEGGREHLLDKGEASYATFDEKSGTINFSGKGNILPSYSFVCKTDPNFRMKTIRIGGKSAEQLIVEMKTQGIIVDGAVIYLMTRKASKNPPPDHVFETTETEREIRIALVDGYDLGLTGEAFGDDMRTAAKKQGLNLLPAEAGPHLRLQYMDQQADEHLTVAMVPIKNYRPSLNGANTFLIRTPVYDYEGSGMVAHPYFEGTHDNWKKGAYQTFAFLIP